ncbi:MAG: sulfurtransferase TusA family protein [Aestuariivita sp.]|nr:sulfurtransferase TusA family protein [Aestuariivita sp.]
MNTISHFLDATGLLCPLPVLKLRKYLKSMHIGEVIEILADDPAAVIDIPHYCSETKQELISATNENNTQIYLIRKIR